MDRNLIARKFSAALWTTRAAEWLDSRLGHSEEIFRVAVLPLLEQTVQEVRNAARQASGQPVCACSHPFDRHNTACAHCPCVGYAQTWPPQASGQQPDNAAGAPDPTTADDPTPLRWGLGDVLHSDDDTVIVCMSGPDREPYWLELDPERAAALRDDLAPLEEETHVVTDDSDDPEHIDDCPGCEAFSLTGHVATPAAGLSDTQPTVDRAAVRERVRLAIAAQWLDEMGSDRTVDDLDDSEFDTFADAVLAALGKITTPTVEETSR
jgi:hypothetical protein